MSSRIPKINAEIQKYISEIFTYDIKNPNIHGIITVTRVDTTNDLSLSKVYVSVFCPKGDKYEVFNQILHSAGYIRKSVCEKLNIRKMPFLEFILDETLDYSEHIEEVINDLKK
ncbi:MAG: 30S ribosome-binding factor RbfA [Clostridia bacterium]|nr:30S ribosome-binding factor RbfA [Clostridia bacterium]